MDAHKMENSTLYGVGITSSGGLHGELLINYKNLQFLLQA